MKNIPSTLKGFRDFLPAEKRRRDFVANKIKQVMENWGFSPIETPTLESLELFAGQIGEDEKLFFKFTDNGGRDVALRYDQTVPTCRFIAEHQNEFPRIFKRYQLQNVFRAEKPQRGRYREFTQFDADIFGTLSPIADAEMIALSLEIYRQLGFDQAVVAFNDRKLVKDFPYEAIVALDKLDKIGQDGVIADMVDKGIELSKAKEYFQAMTQVQPNETVTLIQDYLRDYGFSEDWFRFDPTIARSFAYSDGPIWEVKIPGYEVGSVLGGERFDGLTKQITGQDIPGTGFGIGFDRTVEAVEALGLMPEFADAGAQVLVTVFDQKLAPASGSVAMQLRVAGIATELYPAADKLGKQFKYANQKNIPYVVVLGEEELAQGKVNLKDMMSGEQEILEMSQLISKF